MGDLTGANACDGISPHGPCFPPYAPANYVGTELNFFKPIPGWSDIAMDGQSGKLNGTPTMNGWFTYGFTIHENRNGQIINSTNFDYLTIIGLTSSIENVTKSHIQVLGNPSSDSFYVSIEDSEQFDLQLTDMNGHKVYFTKDQQASLTELSIDGPSGVYILSISNGKTFKTAKLVKL